LEIDPNYAHAWHGLAAFGNILGTMDEALAALRQAQRLEPLSAAIACDFGFLLYWARRYVEAIDACRRALDLHPSFARTYVPLARAHAAQGHYDEAAGRFTMPAPTCARSARNARVLAHLFRFAPSSAM